MVTKDDFLKLLSQRLNRLLCYAELVAPAEKFQVFRKLVLDEFGRDGLARDLAALIERKAQERQGTGGLIPRKKDGVL